jgi:hypothetical protein
VRIKQRLMMPVWSGLIKWNPGLQLDAESTGCQELYDHLPRYCSFLGFHYAAVLSTPEPCCAIFRFSRLFFVCGGDVLVDIASSNILEVLASMSSIGLWSSLIFLRRCASDSSAVSCGPRALDGGEKVVSLEVIFS